MDARGQPFRRQPDLRAERGAVVQEQVPQACRSVQAARGEQLRVLGRPRDLPWAAQTGNASGGPKRRCVRRAMRQAPPHPERAQFFVPR